MEYKEIGHGTKTLVQGNPLGIYRPSLTRGKPWPIFPHQTLRVVRDNISTGTTQNSGYLVSEALDMRRELPVCIMRGDVGTRTRGPQVPAGESHQNFPDSPIGKFLGLEISK